LPFLQYEDAVADLRRFRRDAQLRSGEKSATISALGGNRMALYDLRRRLGTTAILAEAAVHELIHRRADSSRGRSCSEYFGRRHSGLASAKCAATCWPSIRPQHKVQLRWSTQLEAMTACFSTARVSFLNAEGNIIARDVPSKKISSTSTQRKLTGDLHEQLEGEEASVYGALVLGTRDYIQKCGFRKAIIATQRRDRFGADGGHRRRRVGAENVIGVGMPDRILRRDRSMTRVHWRAILDSFRAALDQLRR